jgi:hypothetical protein
LRKREREFKERKKSIGALKFSSTHIALAVQDKPVASPDFSQIACLTAVIVLELFFRFPREKPSLVKERKREREGRPERSTIARLWWGGSPGT